MFWFGQVFCDNYLTRSWVDLSSISRTEFSKTFVNIKSYKVTRCVSCNWRCPNCLFWFWILISLLKLCTRVISTFSYFEVRKIDDNPRVRTQVNSALGQIIVTLILAWLTFLSNKKGFNWYEKSIHYYYNLWSRFKISIK